MAPCCFAHNVCKVIKNGFLWNQEDSHGATSFYKDVVLTAFEMVQCWATTAILKCAHSALYFCIDFHETCEGPAHTKSYATPQ